MAQAYLQKGYPEHYQSLTDKYGPVVRVGPNKVLYNDIDALYRISGVRFYEHKWYTMSKYPRHRKHILSLTEPEPLREEKKYIGPAV